MSAVYELELSRKNMMILLLLIVTLALSSVPNQLDSYRSTFKDERIQTIMMTPDQPALYDSLAQLHTDEANFEMGRLCFSQGLYQQAKTYFNLCPPTNIRDIYLIWTAAILDEELELAKPDGFNDFMRLLENDTNLTGYLANFAVSDKALAKPADNNDIDSRYTVQFGAFSTLEMAERLEKKLRENGIVPRIEPSEDGSLYRVRAGRFEEREKAEDFGDRLNMIYTIIDREGKHE